MELFLNLLWLLIACSALAWWCAVRRPWAAPKRQMRCEGIALACALLLLFPVISLTDDLHAELLTVEDAASSRKHLRSGAHALPDQAASNKILRHQATAVIPAVWRPAGALVFCTRCFPMDSSPVLLISRAVSGRSPPSLPL